MFANQKHKLFCQDGVCARCGLKGMGSTYVIPECLCSVVVREGVPKTWNVFVWSWAAKNQKIPSPVNKVCSEIQALVEDPLPAQIH